MSKSWAGGSTRAWRRTRLLVLARDGWRCRIRTPGTWKTRDGQMRRCLGRADCVHHTRGKAVTGDDPQYLIAACGPCNLKLGNPARNAKHDPPGRSMTKW